MEKKNILIVFMALILVAVSIVFVAGQITTFIIHNTGSITETQDIHTDASTLNWGTVDPGVTAKKIIYVWNTGTQLVTITYMVSNFQPSQAQPSFTLSWNYTGQQVGITPVPIEFSLTPSVSIQNVSEFSFDITINAV